MKKQIIYFIFCILLLSSVTALITSSGSRIIYYNLTNNVKDEWNAKDLTASETLTYSSGGVDFESSDSNDYAYWTSANANLTTATSNSFTACFFVGIESISDNSYIYDERNNNGWQLRISNSGGYKFGYVFDGTSAAAYYTISTINDNTNYTTCVTYNGVADKGSIWFNGNNQTQFSNDLLVSDDTYTYLGVLGTASARTSGSYFDGRIFEFCSFNRILSKTEIKEFNDSKSCEGTSITPTLFLQHNLITESNYNLPEKVYYFNVSEQYSMINNVNCSMYVNNVINQTKKMLPVDTYPTYDGVYNFTLPFGNIEKNYSVMLSCYDELGTGTRINTSKIIINIDRINPEIYSNFVNNSVYTQLDEITYYSNYSDMNLFAYNISIHNKSNDKLYQNKLYFATSLLNNFYENVTSWTLTNIGNFSIKSTVWDSHTANEINNYKVDKTKNSLKFEDKISIYSDDILNTDSVKEKDRYSFNLEFDNKKDWKKVYIESTENLTYLPYSKYKLHFVDLSNSKWIDFESSGFTEFKITKVNNKKYELDLLTDNKQKVIKFNSIGDLNKNTKFYYFKVENIPTSSISNTTNVNLTGIETAINNLSGGLNMIWIIILYGLILVTSFWMIKTNNNLFGQALLFSSIGFDFFFVVKLFNDYIKDNMTDDLTGWSLTIFGFLLGSVLIVKIAFIIFAKYTTIQKNKD
jgi:hypothetical protein